MAILRCKMCGGQLEVSGQESVVTCDYCGSRQTLPTLDHEKKQNLFNRANRLRMANEFDKASGVFESIVAEFPEEAEAYWGLVLCSYGIEYVDDPLTKTKIPTCHRTSYESIFNDVNYDLALEYADREAMLLYRKEAKEIDRIQKDILRIAASEEPFDVFICYKETDEQGQRTKDSVLAQDMYERLTEKGFKVFFSRITLEDKLGHEYEPYIFSALNSSKVMLVVGTDYEYFQSVWVKNEWSRYLELTKKDKNKLLIPCYADIDAYDLPVEFRNLQGQDMNKIGFMQDLIRGIQKVVGKEDKIIEKISSKEEVSNSQMSPLLVRAFIFLEDEKWNDATSYCERVLDVDPKNAYAYLGELLAELQVKTVDELANQNEPLDNNSNYQKILRFGDDELIDKITGCNQKIIDRIENERLAKLYENAKRAFNHASSTIQYENAISLFNEISNFNDSKSYIEQCHSKIKDIQNGQLYKNAESKIDGTILGYENAIEAFRQIEHWNDVDERIHFCLNKIEEIRQKQIEEQKEKERQEALRKAEQERLEKQRQVEILRQEALRREKEAEQARIAEQKRLEKEKQEELKRQKEAQLLEAKRLKEEKRSVAEQARIRRKAEQAVAENKKKPLMLILCFVLLIAGGLGTYFAMLPSINYKKAQELLVNQQYDDAYELFVSLDDYKDCKQILNDFDLIKTYDYAKNLYDKNINASDEKLVLSEVTEAKNIFVELGEFRDSQTLSVELQGVMKEKWQLADVGSSIYFGSYEQDGNTTNGPEDIEWIVLDKKDNKIFVISKMILDYQPFSKEQSTWEKSYLREWLNTAFLNSAFNDSEKRNIISNSYHSNCKYSYNNQVDKTNTKDSIYLLGEEEFYKYQSLNFDWITTSTMHQTENMKWWLRDSLLYGFNGNNSSVMTLAVNDFHSIIKLGIGSTVYGIEKFQESGVRPVMWIDLDGYMAVEDADVGNLVKFGSYEQDANPDNGTESIEWQVLDRKDNRLLVISSKGLVCKEYHDEFEDVTWDVCTLRNWLNNDFLEDAFSEIEKSLIVDTSVSADKNPKYDTNQGVATDDKLFLLSVQEVEKYFGSPNQRECKFSQFSKQSGFHKLDENCWWWLRTSGYSQTSAARIGPTGTFDLTGNHVSSDQNAVRPAMWIKISE